MINFTTDRRSIVKGAAWAVPAISVAAAAPSLAASPADAPNLSTSMSGGTPTRSGSTVTIAPSTIINSGGVAAEGLAVNFVTSSPIMNLQLRVFGTTIVDAEGFLGIAVEGLTTTNVTMTVPAGTNLGQVHIEPDGQYVSPADQMLIFGGADPVNLAVTATASNGGIPFTPDQVTV